jgi:hypothetical protein
MGSSGRRDEQSSVRRQSGSRCHMSDSRVVWATDTVGPSYRRAVWTTDTVGQAAAVRGGAGVDARRVARSGGTRWRVGRRHGQNGDTQMKV